MSIGSRIRFFRNLRGLTQLSLGRLLGYSDVTADVRIANYESGRRTPKPETIAEIADALMVSTEAITAPEADDLTGVMHILFLLEDVYGLEITDSDGKPCLMLSKESKQHSEIKQRLTEYLAVANKLRNDQITKEEYDRWRYQYSKSHKIAK